LASYRLSIARVSGTVSGLILWNGVLAFLAGFCARAWPFEAGAGVSASRSSSAVKVATATPASFVRCFLSALTAGTAGLEEAPFVFFFGCLVSSSLEPLSEDDDELDDETDFFFMRTLVFFSFALPSSSEDEDEDEDDDEDDDDEAVGLAFDFYQRHSFLVRG